MSIFEIIIIMINFIKTFFRDHHVYSAFEDLYGVKVELQIEVN